MITFKLISISWRDVEIVNWHIYHFSIYKKKLFNTSFCDLFDKIIQGTIRNLNRTTCRTGKNRGEIDGPEYWTAIQSPYWWNILQGVGPRTTVYLELDDEQIQRTVRLITLAPMASKCAFKSWIIGVLVLKVMTLSTPESSPTHKIAANQHPFQRWQYKVSWSSLASRKNSQNSV